MVFSPSVGVKMYFMFLLNNKQCVSETLQISNGIIYANDKTLSNPNFMNKNVTALFLRWIIL